MDTDFQQTSRCAHCLLPQTMPFISFDNDGVCNYCDDYQPFDIKGEQALQQILSSARDRKSEFDCIVNVSGGRDSSYAILNMVKDYGLKVLAVNYQNPFTHPLAIENLEKIRDILKVKMISFSFKPGFHQKLLKNNLIALLKKPDPAMVPMLCISCKLIWKNILDIANAYKIRLIISGGNPYERTSFKRILLGGQANQPEKSYYTRYISGLIKHAIKNISYLKPSIMISTIKGYLYSNPYSPMVRIRGRHINKVDLFHYLPWDEAEILTRLQNELDWRYPDKSGSWRFDCRIGHLKDYLYLKLLGLTEKDDFYSRLIREHKITRGNALNRVEKENQVDMASIAHLLESIDLDMAILK